HTRSSVRQRYPKPVNFAVLQCGCGRRLVRDDDPLDPVGRDPLTACQPGSWFRARPIISDFLERRLGARRPFLLDEAHGATADMLVNLLVWVGRGNASWHYEAARCADLAQRQQYFWVGFFQ